MSALHESIRRQWVDNFFRRQVAMFPSTTHLLDLGGTKVEKRGNFDLAAYGLAVTYVNLGMEKAPDVQADAAMLPFASATFDAVICAELLEHVADPVSVLTQVWQVLKPGGRLLISVPFLYRIHGDPYDFGRYTDHYWQEQLTRSRFERLSIERHGLFFSVLLDMSKQYANRKAQRPLRWLLAPLFTWLQTIAAQHEAQPSVLNDVFIRSFTTGFGIIAHKPSHYPTER